MDAAQLAELGTLFLLSRWSGSETQHLPSPLVFHNIFVSQAAPTATPSMVLVCLALASASSFFPPSLRVVPLGLPMQNQGSICAVGMNQTARLVSLRLPACHLLGRDFSRAAAPSH